MSVVDRVDVSRRRARAGRIREGMKSYIYTLAEIAAAYAERDWEHLGYETWDAYVKEEFDAGRLGLPAEQRQKAVVELRLAGLSQREIGSALNVDAATVNRDLRGVANATRELQSPQVSESDPAQTPARRDPEPAHFPGPAVATPDEPAQPDEVAAVGEDEAVTSSAEPQRWDPADRAEHDASVRRTQEIEAGRRAVKSVLSDLRTHVITIVSASRLGEHGLVTKELVAGLRRSIDMLEEEIDQ